MKWTAAILDFFKFLQYQKQSWKALIQSSGIDLKAIRSVDVEILLRMDGHHIGGSHLRFFSTWSNIVDFLGEVMVSI